MARNLSDIRSACEWNATTIWVTTTVSADVRDNRTAMRRLADECRALR